MNATQRTSTLDASLRCLAHPLSWLAVAILLCNDHLFKTLTPSWFTGKLSDFAGLFFFPFVLAALLSLPLDRLRASSRKAGGLAILITGVCFALIKLVPVINSLASEVLSQVIGYRTTFVLDPTDLLALSMLLPAWWLWSQPTQVIRKRAGWVALVIGAAASLASTPVRTPVGIVGLEIAARDGATSNKNNLFAYAGPRSDCDSCYTPSMQFESLDGGLTWGAAQLMYPTSNEYYTSSDEYYAKLHAADEARLPQWLLHDPKNVSIIYRFTRGQGIERSTDSGRTWVSELILQPFTEAQQKYYQRYTYGDPRIVQGPFESVIDLDTGNVIASMGVEGVLVKTPDELWQWVKVGDYGHANPTGIDTLGVLDALELWLGAILAGLMLGVGAWAWGCRFRSLTAALILGFAGMAVAYLAGSARTYIPGGIDGMQLWMLGALSVASLAALIAAYRGLTYPMEHRGRAIGIALASMILFWLPFVLWTQNIIPSWQAAMVIATLAALVMLAIQYSSLRRLARSHAALSSS